MDNVVIVGAGLAGYRAAVALRKLGFDKSLTVVGDEPHLPYDRPPLSKQFLEGAMPTGDLTFPTDDLDVAWRLGSGAASLDTATCRVGLHDGDMVAYDALIIATGRSARPWPTDAGLAGVHVLRSLEDSLTLRLAVRPATRAVIIGAGFIGCEVASTLRGRGLHVTLIDVAETPMRVLGPQASRMCADYHRNQGVQLRLRSSVSRLHHSGGHVTGVELDDGELIPAEVVVVGVGSTPNTGWLAGSGIELRAGNVVCDEQLFAVGAPGVMAIGDVAEIPRPNTDDRVCVEHWTNARDMAYLAAHNLLADPADRRAFAALPTFWSNQYSLNIKSVGFLGCADSFTVVAEDPAKPALVVEAHRDGRIVAAVTINRNRQMIEYTRALSTGALIEMP